MVQSHVRNDDREPHTPKQAHRRASSLGQTDTDDWEVIRQAFLSEGYDLDTVDILLRGWRKGTKACYRPYIHMWMKYCKEKSISITNPTAPQALTFLTDLHSKCYKYNQINTLRSVLSIIIRVKNNTWGKLPVVKKYMKGIFESEAVFPKYNIIWNVSNVFNFFRHMPLPHELGLKELSQKLCLLLILITGGQRCQTIHNIQIADLKILDGKLFTPIMSKIKQTRPSLHMEPLKIKP